MALRWLSDLVGTKLDGFRIKLALISASALSAARTYTLPDATGTVALVDYAQTFTVNQTFSAQVAVGSVTTAASLTVNKNMTGGTTALGIISRGDVQSDVTSAGFGVRSQIGTAADVFISAVYQFYAQQGTVGADSAVITQYGYAVGANLTGASTNYGFHSGLAAASGVWAFYGSGTAQSALGGPLRVGSATAPTAYVHSAASTTSMASLCLPHGTAPTAPVNGDGWTTTADLLFRINGTTRTYVNTDVAQTLTNKRITARVQAVSSSATVTPNADNDDVVTITAQAAALTLAAPSGTPTQGQRLVIRIKDNGTARAITSNAIYRAIGTTIPTTTVISKTVYLGCIYNSTDTKWDVVAVAQEA